MPLPAFIEFPRIWQALDIACKLLWAVSDSHEEVGQFRIYVVENFDSAWRLVQQNRRGSTEDFHIPRVLGNER